MVILTFDIEEWFHILDRDAPNRESEWGHYESRIHENTDRILTLLSEQQQQATFFCLGWIAEKYPEVIRRISDAGHEIASHSLRHKLVHTMNERSFRADTERSIYLLEDLTGKKVRAYRAPGFSFNNQTLWAFDVLVSLGIEIDCSIMPTVYDHGGYTSLNVREPFILDHNGHMLKAFPMTYAEFAATQLVVSGGGYFRLLPWHVIAFLLKRQPYNMTYFHPRDFDALQPRIPEFIVLRRIKSYIGLSRSLIKLGKLLDQFECIDLSQADLQTDWNQAPRIRLK